MEETIPITSNLYRLLESIPDLSPLERHRRTLIAAAFVGRTRRRFSHFMQMN